MHERTEQPAYEPDAVELEVFRYAIESVVDELDANITRTAHSPLVYETKDYAVGILTADFRLLSQSKYNLPIFVAGISEPVRDAVSVIGVERLEPGDVFITNYGPALGSHLNNVVGVGPVFDKSDRVVAYVAIQMHWPDIGGLQPGSLSWDSRSIFHEGAQYRGLKIMSRGEIVPEVLATLRANSWMPELLAGDVMAHVAACTLGVRRWNEQVASRWSHEEVTALTSLQLAKSTELALAAVRELPDGRFRASVTMDDSGAPGTSPLELSVDVEIEGDRLTVDLSGLPPQVEAPINAGAVMARSAVRVALKSVLAPERPADDGLFAPFAITIPEGTVMSASGTAPMSWWNQLAPTLIDLVVHAIGQADPTLVPAGHFAALTIVSVTGTDRAGKRFMMYLSCPGGLGAHSDADGFGPVMSLMHGDQPRTADEIYEAKYPIRVLSRRARWEACGDGFHRGGPGMEAVIEVLDDVVIGASINRTKMPAWGAAGGMPGAPAEIHVAAPGGEQWTPVGSVSRLPLPRGGRIRLRTPGGGGWGTPPVKSRQTSSGKELPDATPR